MKINKILKECKIGDSVQVSGWITTCRKQKNISFIKCNDGTTTEGIQLIWEEVNAEKQNKLQTGSSISVCGILVESPAKGQDVEVKVDTINILGTADPDEYPLAKTRINLETMRGFLHLRFRTNTFRSVFKIKSGISLATHNFFANEDFLHLDPNIITLNECEGGAGVFQVTENDLSQVNKLPIKEGKYLWDKDHFNKPVYLTVSSQLQLEAIACALGGVYTTNKSFRSEHSCSTKHLSEFTHLEIEDIFNTMEDLMDIGERYIKFVSKYILENLLTEVESLNKFVSKGITERIKTIMNAKFHRITYNDAIQIVQESTIKDKPLMGDDLNSESENYLTEYFKGSVFVTHWPINIKSFYMKQSENNTCESFDLLMPYKIGELIGGSMREDNYDKLLSMMKQKNVDDDKLKFYTDLRKFGTVPHGGFGLGMDRLCMLFTGMENIKDVIPFPVQYQNCEF